MSQEEFPGTPHCWAFHGSSIPPSATRQIWTQTPYEWLSGPINSPGDAIKYCSLPGSETGPPGVQPDFSLLLLPSLLSSEETDVHLHLPHQSSSMWRLAFQSHLSSHSSSCCQRQTGPSEGFTPHSGVTDVSTSSAWSRNEQSTSVQEQETKICNTTPGSSLGLQSGKQNRTIFQVLLCYCLYNVPKNIFWVIHLQSNKNNGCCHLCERNRRIRERFYFTEGKWHRCLEPFARGMEICAQGVSSSRWDSPHHCREEERPTRQLPVVTMGRATSSGGF